MVFVKLPFNICFYCDSRPSCNWASDVEKGRMGIFREVHDDIMIGIHSPHYWPFGRGVSPGITLTEEQSCGNFIFSLFLAWTNCCMIFWGCETPCDVTVIWGLELPQGRVITDAFQFATPLVFTPRVRIACPSVLAFLLSLKTVCVIKPIMLVADASQTNIQWRDKNLEWNDNLSTCLTVRQASCTGYQLFWKYVRTGPQWCEDSRALFLHIPACLEGVWRKKHHSVTPLSNLMSIGHQPNSVG